MRPRPLSLVALVAIHAAALPAAAQLTEFRLDDGGQWVEAARPAPGTDAAVIAHARELIASGRPGQAKEVLDDWIDKNKRSGSSWLAQAYLLRGDARTADGDEFKALYDYEEVVRSFPGTEEFVRAVERELDIAVRYVNGMKRKLWGFRVARANEIGEELLIRVHERLPGSRLGERAIIELADYYYRARELKLASQVYELFIENYPQSQYRKKAMQRRIYANVARFKGPSYDASGLVEAQVLIRNFAQRFPADAEKAGLSDALVARLDESAAAQMLETARWYIRREDPVSARYTLRRLLLAHPRTVAAEHALDIMQERGWTLTDERRPPRPSAPEPAAEASPPPEPAPVVAPGAAEPSPRGEEELP